MTWTVNSELSWTRNSTPVILRLHFVDAPDSTQQIHMWRDLFEVCYVQASGRGDDLERQHRAQVEEILTFFGKLWRSPPARVSPRLLQPRVSCAGR